jgi:hypothetical protein
MALGKTKYTSNFLTLHPDTCHDRDDALDLKTRFINVQPEQAFMADEYPLTNSQEWSSLERNAWLMASFCNELVS